MFIILNRFLVLDKQNLIDVSPLIQKNHYLKLIVDNCV